MASKTLFISWMDKVSRELIKWLRMALRWSKKGDSLTDIQAVSYNGSKGVKTVLII